ncbi:MAG: metallophosphoesterase [Euryarchaeota archaeon]|nr:metallophosphoesterase [Euryarchaeota archaeon]
MKRRIAQFIIFISIFSIGYFALNYYVVSIMSNLLQVSKSEIFYIFLFIIAFSYPVAALLERMMSNILTRILYTISSAWMGMVFFILFFLIIYGILSLGLKIPTVIAGAVIVILASILSIYSILNGFSLNIEEIEVPLKNIESGESEMRVVQLSDIHIGSIRNSGYLKRIVDKTNNLKPDIVLITGDMVDGSARLHKHTFCAIDEIKAPVLFVTGNHEIYEGLNEVSRVLKPTKIKILQNEMIEFNAIQIVGVDYSFDRDHLLRVLKGLRIQKNKPTILMYHFPQGLNVASEAGVNLQLSGHTHAGQIFPFNMLVRLIFPYFKGLYEYNGTYLYVSQGTGTWGPPMRLGSRNEITLIKLKHI